MVSADGWLCNLFLFRFFLQRKDCTSVGEQQLQVLGFFFVFFFSPFYSVDLSSNFCEPIAKTCQFRRLCELKGGKLGKLHLPRLWFVGTVEDLTDRFL